MSTVNLGANISIQAFNVRVSEVTNTANGQVVNIGSVVTSPAGSIVLAVLYSVDSGSTYKTATITAGTPIVVPAGGALYTQLVWDAFTDLGESLYNKSIYLQVTCTDGTHVSAPVVVTTRVEKATGTPRTFDRIANKSATGAAAVTNIRKIGNNA
jgi:hypothetical protein